MGGRYRHRYIDPTSADSVPALQPPARLPALARLRCLFWLGCLLALPGTAALSAPAPVLAPVPPTSAGAAPAPGTGLVTIESDRQQADNRTGIVTATGNVRIAYPDRSMVATSRQAQYFTREGRLVLSGDVEVVDGDGQRIRAETLVYRLDSERLVAEPPTGRQVTSTLRLRSNRPATGQPALLP